jgi:hypothetical protein
MFENTYINAVTLLLLFFGISVAFIFLSAYLWMRQQKTPQ